MNEFWAAIDLPFRNTIGSDYGLEIVSMQARSECINRAMTGLP